MTTTEFRDIRRAHARFVQAMRAFDRGESVDLESAVRAIVAFPKARDALARTNAIARARGMVGEGTRLAAALRVIERVLGEADDDLAFDGEEV